jgi:hypothetical protein
MKRELDVTEQPEPELADVAARMLSGELDLIDGCRRLVQLHRQLGSPEHEAILTIIGIESETDDLPVGPERAQWAASALLEKDRQRDEYLAQVRAPLREALQQLARGHTRIE